MNFGTGTVAFALADPDGSTTPAAAQGVSVKDAVIVWGQDPDEPGDPAELTGAREIPGNGAMSFPRAKMGFGIDGASLLGATQSLMVLSDLWTNETAAAAFFARCLVTPSGDLPVNSIIPGSFSVHLKADNGSFSGGSGSVISAVKGNVVTEGSNPDMKSLATVSGLVAGFLPWGAQNYALIALMRVQSPDGSIGATGVIDKIVGLLIESQATLSGLTVGGTYGVLQEGATDQNTFAGQVGIRTDAFDFPVVALQVGTRGTDNRVIIKGSTPFTIYIANQSATVLVGCTPASGLQVSDTSGNPYAEIHSNGDIECKKLGAGLIMQSPDGTRWRLKVSNAGVVSAVTA